MSKVSESGLEYVESYPAPPTQKAGQYPYRRGIHSEMYRKQFWTMRQYAGFTNARESNARFKKLIQEGATGISIAFDLPTQLGYDSDHKISRGEVGKVGVPISCLEDMRQLLNEIPIDKISTSMTINSPACVLTAMLEIVANERGILSNSLRGTCQNDILKEYISRGTYIFPPKASLRLVTDLIEYAGENLPLWNPISISGYHMAEAGATPVQEIAFALTNAREYVNALLAKGKKIDDFAPNLSFFFAARTNLLEQVCKFRLAREIWAEMMAEEFGAKKEKSKQLRFHAQTAGVQLTAQNPESNIIRVTIQALASILGGAQSLHTNSFDEALSLPSEFSVGIALKTQHILAYETDICNSPDPLGGSYLIESMTNAMKTEVLRIMQEIQDLGGALACIENGYQKSEIEKNAYSVALLEDEANSIEEAAPEDKLYRRGHISNFFRKEEELRISAIAEFKSKRDSNAVMAAKQELLKASQGGDNLMPYIKKCLLFDVTLGEICSTLKSQFGKYRAPESI